MHFPKFWSLARQGGVLAWGWSDVSAEAAQADGVARVSRIIEHLKEGTVDGLGAYGYPDRPMREEVLHEFSTGEGRAVVSRNSYGCLVLNAAQAFFVDVDEKPRGLSGWVASWFGKTKSFDETVREQVDLWLESHPGWGWRVYRTKAGIRLLATHAPVAAEDPQCAEIFETFQADRLYRKLCVNQKCFRARLTPKPWRCQLGRPPTRWPWRDAASEAGFREWEEGYLSAAAGFATCRLIAQVGSSTIHPDLAGLVEFHDKATGVGSDRPLA